MSSSSTRACSTAATWNEFDYVVVNDNFERAAAGLETIVGRGEALRRDRSELQTLLPRLPG